MMFNTSKVAIREGIWDFFHRKIDKKFAFWRGSLDGFGGQTVDFTVPVIDNFGDMGFALSLAIELGERKKNLKIRFFSENFELFLDMMDGIIPSNMEYLDLQDWATVKHSPIRCNFFGYQLREEELLGKKNPTKILNFDYLQFHKDGGMANPGVGSLHGTSYKIAETEVIHIVPSMLPEGAGVIVPGEHYTLSREEFLEYIGETSDSTHRHWCSVFVYPNTLVKMQEIFEKYPDWVFLVCGMDKKIDIKNVITLPFLPLEIYGDFLKICDTNMVRGENSLVSTILAGKPFLWDIYRENNGAHQEKMEDFEEYVNGVIPDFGGVLKSFIENEGMGESVERLFGEDTGGFERLRELVRGRDLCDGVMKILEK